MNIQNQPEQAMQNQNTNTNTNNQMMQQDDDDLDDLGLFHKSSLRNQQQSPLPQIVKQINNVKRYTVQNNQIKIKDYIQLSKLGQGAFAQVKKVSLNNTLYAMKIYSLLRLKSRKFYAADGSFADSQQMFRNQVEILKRLNHGNLAQCHQILYGGNYAYVVMQLCQLGQIMDWSQSKNNFVRNTKVIDYLSTKYKIKSIEDITRIIFLQVSLGLQYLHNNNISNRDIKVDNILCKMTQTQGNDIKIADFTTARYSKDDISYFTCGTAGFRGPQIQSASSDGYSCKAMDIWSLGISMYTYFYQNFPFMGESEYQIQYKVEKQQLQFSQDCPTWFKTVISKMTTKNWKDRININQIIQILTSSQMHN